jgi:hypothetical protein
MVVFVDEEKGGGQIGGTRNHLLKPVLSIK